MRQDGIRAQHRGVVMGPRGIVSAASPVAVSAGIETLRQGGTAVDAALAGAFITGVALPDQCGVGGDAYVLVYEARTQSVHAVLGSGPAPLDIDVSFLERNNFQRMPISGPFSIAVPGAVAAYYAAWQRFGRIDWKALWQSAIQYAEEGVLVGEVTAQHIKGEREKLRQDERLREIFLPNNRPLEMGDVLRQPNLAKTLDRIASSPLGFYAGELGQDMVALLKSQGTRLIGPEWSDCRAEDLAPLHTCYRGWNVFTTPLPSQGFILLEALNLLENFHIRDYGYMNPRAIHLMAEALAMSFSDRLSKIEVGQERVLADILSKRYASERIAQFGVDRATWTQEPAKFSGDTTFVVCADKDGNVACLVHSLGHSFGSGMTVGDTGVIMNNRAGRGFTLQPGPNQLEPGKRTMNTLMGWMVTDNNGHLKWAGGTPGGDGQPQWNLQMLVHLMDWGLNVQEAVEAPRWTLFPGTDSDVRGKPPEFRLENRLLDSVGPMLRNFGYALRVHGEWGAGGGAQIVERNLQGGWVAGSDPRVDGGASAI